MSSIWCAQKQKYPAGVYTSLFKPTQSTTSHFQPTQPTTSLLPSISHHLASSSSPDDNHKYWVTHTMMSHAFYRSVSHYRNRNLKDVANIHVIDWLVIK